MRAPGFWYEPPGWRARVLSPLGALYGLGTARKLRQGARRKPGVPVICVGNLTIGGTGKTPVVMDLAGRLPGAQIVSRGYGGTLEGPVRVDPARHSAAEVGDEPLLLSSFAPVWVAKDRAAGARDAVAAGAKLLLLDDGFQNASLAYDLSIVVIDAARGFGNGRVIPAGPLREPIAKGMARADLALVIGDDAAQRNFEQAWGPRIPVPIVKAALEPLPTGLPLTGTRVIAFAGIGHPEKFFATLRGLGADIARAIPLGDHQPLTPALMSRVEAEAKATGALLVTTEKDAVRLPQAFRQKVSTIPVRLKVEHDHALTEALRKLSSTPASSSEK